MTQSRLKPTACSQQPKAYSLKPAVIIKKQQEMRKLAEGLKEVLKRVATANMNLEHYWFVRNHQIKAAQVEAKAKQSRK